MMEKVTYLIEDIATVSAGGDRPDIVSEVKTEKTMVPIYSNGMDNDGLYGYTDKARVEGDSVTISARGVNVGMVCYREEPFLPIVRLLSLAPNRNIVDAKYLYYVLKNISFSGTGSAQPQITAPMIRKQEIVIHKNPITQKRIAKILSLFDRKIQVNETVNDNLEEQALTLFRQYFMDYAPYGGIVPSDWTEVSLDDVCIRITDGSHYSPADAPESPYPMYSVKDMENYGFNSSSCKHISEEDFQKMQKNDCVPRLNDILVAKDGSYLKEIFICSEEKDEAILSSIAIFRPNTDIIIPEILLYLLKQPSIRKDVGDNYVSGSALPRIVLKDFKKYRFMLPTMNEQLKIGSALHAIRMQIKANIDEIQCLSSTRDTLLPRLMSGELDVSNIDL